MPRIRCHYTDCVFLDDGYCSAAAVELDPDTGCATYAPNEEASAKEDWEEEEEEWEEEEPEEEDDDLWEDDEDEI
jgi:formate hydrogenlyase subunit 6/NADH:ubiquinone oxidoreductase subunit I